MKKPVNGCPMLWSTVLLYLIFSIQVGCGGKEEGKKKGVEQPQTAGIESRAHGGKGAGAVPAVESGGDAETRPAMKSREAGEVEDGEGKPVAVIYGAQERSALENVDLPDSARLAAAESLLEIDVDFLADSYGRPDNARIVRALIERRVAAGDAEVLPLLVGLFEAVGGEERIDFEQYILHFGRRAEGEMMHLLHAGDRSLVMRALDALVKMHSLAAVDSIAVLLRHPEPWVRIGAAHAIGELGGPLAAARLKMTLGDSVYSVVNAALVGLGHLRDPETYEWIAPLVEDGNSHIRKHAAMALGEIGDRRAIPAVRKLAEGDPDSGVRFMAGRALKRLEVER